MSLDNSTGHVGLKSSIWQSTAWGLPHSVLAESWHALIWFWGSPDAIQTEPEVREPLRLLWVAWDPRRLWWMRFRDADRSGSTCTWTCISAGDREATGSGSSSGISHTSELLFHRPNRSTGRALGDADLCLSRTGKGAALGAVKPDLPYSRVQGKLETALPRMNGSFRNLS